MRPRVSGVCAGRSAADMVVTPPGDAPFQAALRHPHSNPSRSMVRGVRCGPFVPQDGGPFRLSVVGQASVVLSNGRSWRCPNGPRTRWTPCVERGRKGHFPLPDRRRQRQRPHPVPPAQCEKPSRPEPRTRLRQRTRQQSLTCASAGRILCVACPCDGPPRSSSMHRSSWLPMPAAPLHSKLAVPRGPWLRSLPER